MDVKRIQELLDEINEKIPKTHEIAFFVCSEEHKKMIKECFPKAKVQIIPREYVEDKNKIYVIPIKLGLDIVVPIDIKWTCGK